MGMREQIVKALADRFGRRGAGDLADWFGKSRIVDEQGLPLVTYKAMRGDVPNMQAETGLSHVALDRKVAEGFSGKDSPVREVYVRAENPFDFRDPRHLEWLSGSMGKPENVAAYNRDTKRLMGPGYTHEADAGFIRAGLGEGAYQAYEVPAVSNLIRSRGHDAMYMLEDFQKANAPNLAVFDPGQIKTIDLLKKYGVGGAAALPTLGAFTAQDTYEARP